MKQFSIEHVYEEEKSADKSTKLLQS